LTGSRGANFAARPLREVGTRGCSSPEQFDARWQKMDDLYCGRDDLPLFSNTGE